MQKIVLIAALTIGLAMIPFLIHAEVYKWIDDKGDVHFTDDYSSIPEKYRPVAETRRFPQDPKDTSPSSVEKKPTPGVEKKPTPALAPEVPEPVVQKEVSEPDAPKEFDGGDYRRPIRPIRPIPPRPPRPPKPSK